MVRSYCKTSQSFFCKALRGSTTIRFLRYFTFEPPIRLLIKAALSNDLARRRAFDWAVLFDAVRYPAYAVGLQAACRYAHLAGATGFLAIEFGVAGGNGLIELSNYAARLSQTTGLQIKVVGFDAGSGLPMSADRRDVPWLWNEGDFPCVEDRLRQLLPKQTELLVGRIQDTLLHWIRKGSELPIGFVSVDVDLYSATAAICDALGNAEVSRLLPFVSFYFDDVLRYLTPRCTGEFAAISEFNREHTDRQFDRDDWISEGRPFAERLWLKRMYSLCCFDHPALQKKRVREVAHLDLVVKSVR
jgi:hypothetical protein